ncbi:hypothetical protein F5Y16DRAFT_402870 [Xylariaceae sp. FL0255]|nr:hypothetical protein F5Y16DRAFT_402870 [Xylariaceae sp. FL0255]
MEDRPKIGNKFDLLRSQEYLQWAQTTVEIFRSQLRLSNRSYFPSSPLSIGSWVDIQYEIRPVQLGYVLRDGRFFPEYADADKTQRPPERQYIPLSPRVSGTRQLRDNSQNWVPMITFNFRPEGLNERPFWELFHEKITFLGERWIGNAEFFKQLGFLGASQWVSSQWVSSGLHCRRPTVLLETCFFTDDALNATMKARFAFFVHHLPKLMQEKWRAWRELNRFRSEPCIHTVDAILTCLSRPSQSRQVPATIWFPLIQVVWQIHGIVSQPQMKRIKLEEEVLECAKQKLEVSALRRRKMGCENYELAEEGEEPGKILEFMLRILQNLKNFPSLIHDRDWFDILGYLVCVKWTQGEEEMSRCISKTPRYVYYGQENKPRSAPGCPHGGKWCSIKNPTKTKQVGQRSN